MKDDLHKDNLENFFHNALGDFGDMPSDDLWNKLEPKIPAKPAGKIAFLGNWRSIAAGGAILLLNWKTAAAAIAIIALSVGTYQWTNYQGKLEAMVQQLKEQQETMNRLEAEMKQKKQAGVFPINDETNPQTLKNSGTKETVTNGVATNQEANKSSYVKEGGVINLSTNAAKKNKVKSLKKITNPSTFIASNRAKGVNISINPSSDIFVNDRDNSINSSINHSPSIVSNSENNYNNTITNNSSNIVGRGVNEGGNNHIMASDLGELKEEKKRSIAMALLDSKDYGALKVKRNKSLTVKDFSLDTEKEGNIFNKKWRVGIYGSPLYGHRQVKEKKRPGPNVDSLQLKKHYETPKVARELGVDVAYQVDKNWYVKTGVNYTKTKNELKEIKNLKYLSSNEQISGGSTNVYSSRYTYSLPTSYGENDVDIVLNRPENVSLENEENLELIVNSELFFEKVSVPLTVGYRTNKNRFGLGLSVEGGLAPSMIVRNGFTINEFKTTREDIFIDKAEVSKQLKGMNNASLEAVASVELAYAATDNVEFTLAPTVKMGMQPIYENDKFKSNPYDLSVRMGMAYYF